MPILKNKTNYMFVYLKLYVEFIQIYLVCSCTIYSKRLTKYLKEDGNLGMFLRKVMVTPYKHSKRGCF